MYWALLEKRIDPELFFRALPHHLPEATTLFVEGAVISNEVKSWLREHVQQGPYLPAKGSMGEPLEDGYFRCSFSIELLTGLARLSESHAEPELCDHIFVYRDTEPLLEYYDFPENEIWLPSTLPETRIGVLASALGVRYGKREA